MLFSLVTLKEVHNQRTTKKNHEMPKNSVAHHLLPAMQLVNQITIYN